MEKLFQPCSRRNRVATRVFGLRLANFRATHGPAGELAPLRGITNPILDRVVRRGMRLATCTIMRKLKSEVEIPETIWEITYRRGQIG